MKEQFQRAAQTVRAQPSHKALVPSSRGAPAKTDSRLRLQVAPSAQAILTAGDPIKNARAILRNALPVDNKPIRKVARELESISEALRIPGSKAFGPVSRSVRSAESTLGNQLATITKAFADDKRQDGLEGIEQLKLAFKTLDAAVDAKDKSDIFAAQQVCLQYVGQIQEAMVKGFPFEVCSCRLASVTSGGLEVAQMAPLVRAGP